MGAIFGVLGLGVRDLRYTRTRRDWWWNGEGASGLMAARCGICQQASGRWAGR
jgi:hypothetical protein